MTGWDLGGGGGNSFPFEYLNDFVRGRVVDLTERQQTDINTREPLFWDAEHNQPMMMQALTLQTELRDPNNPSDDGKRTVMLKGSKKSEDMTTMSAVLDAVRESTGATELKYGGELVVQYVSERKAKGGGNFKAKCYKAWYTPPAMDLEQPQQDRQQAQQQQNTNMQQPPYSNYQNPPGGQQQGAQGNYQQPPAGGGWTPPPGQQQQQQGMHQPPPQHYGQQQQGPPPGQQQQSGPPTGAGTQHQQQWPPQDSGPAPQWAQQEPPQNDPWGPPQQNNPAWGQQQQGAPSNDPWGQQPAPGQQSQAQAQAQQAGQQQQSPPAQQAPAGEPITQAQVEAVKAAHVDPASVFGQDYRERIVAG